MDYTTELEMTGLAKTVNYQNKQRVAVMDHYYIGDLYNGEEIRGISKPWTERKMLGGEYAGEIVNAKYQYIYFG